MTYPVDKTFSILLALANGPATGSEIGQQVSGDTLAANYLQKSSLYAMLKRLTADRLIEQLDFASYTQHTKRQTFRPFHLTQKGWQALERGIPQLEMQLQLTRKRIHAKRYL